MADSLLKASHLTKTFEAHKEANAECSVSFQDWQTKKESEHPQFKYWSLVMQFQLSILQMVHSLRCENFTKYVESLTKLMPWLFALDHTHYARWLSVHIRDMTMLEHTHPEVFCGQKKQEQILVSRTKTVHVVVIALVSRTKTMLYVVVIVLVSMCLWL